MRSRLALCAVGMVGRPGQGMASTRRAALGKAVASRDLSGGVFSKWSRSFHAQSFGCGSGMTKAVKAGRSSLVNSTGKRPPAPEASRTGTARHGGRSLVCGSRYGDDKWMQGQGRGFSVYRKREKLTVVLDMDECLLHSRFEEDMRDERGRELAHQLLPNGDSESFHYQHQADVGEALGDVRHRSVDYFWLELEEGERVRVNLRPGVEAFLQRLSDEYNVFVFTAATETYARPVLDRLDPTGSLLDGRFYRPACRHVHGTYLKDLRRIQAGLGKADLSRVVLVDNNPLSFVPQPENGILVPSFYDDAEDRTLEAVGEMIDRRLAPLDDVRPFLGDFFQLRAQLQLVRRRLLGAEERKEAVGEAGREAGEGQWQGQEKSG